jgi:8-oxo-dGTP pyrophosphatase MutT (NUDIX family)
MLRHLRFRLLMALRAVWSPTVMGVAAIVEDARGQVLLVRQRFDPDWRLPGGGVNRGEPAQAAVLRELAEEVGLTGGTAQFFGLYSSQVGWATAVVALYRVNGADVNFRPNLEITDICFVDPQLPPADCAPATLRRLRELTGAAQLSPHW